MTHSNSHSHHFPIIDGIPCVSRARREIGLNHSQRLEQQNLPEWNVVWRQGNKKDNVLPDVSSKEYLPISDINIDCSLEFFVNQPFSNLLRLQSYHTGFGSSINHHLNHPKPDLI